MPAQLAYRICIDITVLVYQLQARGNSLNSMKTQVNKKET